MRLFTIEKVQGTREECVWRHFELSDTYRAGHILTLALTACAAGLGGMLWGAQQHLWFAAVVVVLLLPLFLVSVVTSAHSNYHRKCAIRLQCGMPSETRSSIWGEEGNGT